MTPLAKPLKEHKYCLECLGRKDETVRNPDNTTPEDHETVMKEVVIIQFRSRMYTGEEKNLVLRQDGSQKVMHRFTRNLITRQCSSTDFFTHT